MGIRLVEEVMDYADALGLSYREKWGLAVLARDANEQTRLTYHHATDAEILRRAGLAGDPWGQVRAALVRKRCLVVVERGRRGEGARYFLPILHQLVHPADAEARQLTVHGERESGRMTVHGERESGRMTVHGERESGVAPYSSSSSSSTTSSSPVPAASPVPRPHLEDGVGEDAAARKNAMQRAAMVYQKLPRGPRQLGVPPAQLNYVLGHVADALQRGCTEQDVIKHLLDMPPTGVGHAASWIPVKLGGLAPHQPQPAATMDRLRERLDDVGAPLRTLADREPESAEYASVRDALRRQRRGG